uniref:Uncharacterized protein n=1 Tax=Anguilla anguilla TaxID=7936 RepID=A0A0E9VJD9_ANGAN
MNNIIGPRMMQIKINCFIPENLCISKLTVSKSSPSKKLNY